MSRFIQDHFQNFRRCSNFLLAVGLGGWLLPAFSYGMVIACALVLTMTCLRVYLFAVQDPARDRPMKPHHKRILFVGSGILGAAFIAGIVLVFAVSPTKLFIRGVYLPAIIVAETFPVVTLLTVIVSLLVIIVAAKWERVWGLSVLGFLLIACGWLAATWALSDVALD